MKQRRDLGRHMGGHSLSQPFALKILTLSFVSFLSLSSYIQRVEGQAFPAMVTYAKDKDSGDNSLFVANTFDDSVKQYVDLVKGKNGEITDISVGVIKDIETTTMFTSAYFCDDNNNIYKTDLSGETDGNDIEVILEASKTSTPLGECSSLSLDDGNNMLYIADKTKGAIVSLDLTTKDNTVSNVLYISNPTSVAYDNKLETLFYAAGGIIYSYNVKTEKNQMFYFGTDSEASIVDMEVDPSTLSLYFVLSNSASTKNNGVYSTSTTSAKSLSLLFSPSSTINQDKDSSTTTTSATIEYRNSADTLRVEVDSHSSAVFIFDASASQIYSLNTETSSSSIIFDFCKMTSLLSMSSSTTTAFGVGALVCAPTAAPTSAPTHPTTSPTSLPTLLPTSIPTKRPTEHPTESPTFRPTASPTTDPTALPTGFPTTEPTALPTTTPTARPTSFPTEEPTAMPTGFPTSSPTGLPTVHPTKLPTPSPTSLPTGLPTDSPTKFPTSLPSEHPTSFPTSFPTGFPTIRPTSLPTEFPTSSPTSWPTTTPTALPTGFPTEKPTGLPTHSPTERPTHSPTPVCEPLCSWELTNLVESIDTLQSRLKKMGVEQDNDGNFYIAADVSEQQFNALSAHEDKGLMTHESSTSLNKLNQKELLGQGQPKTSLHNLLSFTNGGKVTSHGRVNTPTMVVIVITSTVLSIFAGIYVERRRHSGAFQQTNSTTYNRFSLPFL